MHEIAVVSVCVNSSPHQVLSRLEGTHSCEAFLVYRRPPPLRVFESPTQELQRFMSLILYVNALVELGGRNMCEKTPPMLA